MTGCSDVQAPAQRPSSAGIRGLVRGHDRYRAGTLNLIASENVISPAVRNVLDSDLEGRYSDYSGTDLAARKYSGNRFVVELDRMCAELARETFNAQAVELRAISGHVAGNAVLMALCRPGDLVMEVGHAGGGHRLAAKLAEAPLVDLQVEFLPFDPHRFNVDPEAAAAVIADRRPRCVVLGSSTFLHPHPVEELAAACRQVGTILVYDGSHVMGLLAAGRFQRPLDEGADLLFGSTHKTLFGPQGGLILGREELVHAAATALYPPLVTNHHPFRIPALATALLEHADFGREYADTVIANARAFQDELERHGLPTAGGRTESHVVLLLSDDRSGAECTHALEEQGIIANASRPPDQLGGQGVRFGLQELTRRGGTTANARRSARLVAQVLAGERCQSEISAAATDLDSLAYTWPDA